MIISNIKKLKPMELGLAIFLLIQFVMIAFCNMTLIEQKLDCDNAKVFRHIVEIWERKTLAIPDWTYTTTLEWDCGSILAIPFYGLTGNIYWAFGLANIVFTGTLIASLFFLFRGKGLLYPILCANLICIPYRTGMLDYFNMLFFAGAQYIVKILIPIVLVGIILWTESDQTEERKSKLLLAFWVCVYVFLLLITCVSSGVYVVACGLVPIFVVYIGYKFFKWEKVSGRIVLLGAISVAFLMVGIYFNSCIMGGSRGNSMVFCSIYQMLANVSSAFFGMFELFGGTTEAFDMAILSVNGIAMFAKICLVLVMLVCGVISIVKCVKKQADLRTLLLMAIFIWNYLVLNVANVRAGSATSEYRYHLIGMLPLLCVTCATLTDGLYKLMVKQQKWMYLTGCIVILFLNVVSYNSFFSEGEKNADLKELTTYCNELDLEFVYMYEGSNDSDICRVLDDSALYVCLRQNGTTWIYDYYNYYVEGAMQPEKAIVVVNDANHTFEDTFTILDKTLVKFDNVAGRSLYYFAVQ